MIMDRQEVINKLEEIFQDVFDDDSLKLKEDMTSADIEDWDSLHQISILVAAAAEFDIKIAISEARHLENIGALVDLIIQRKK